MKSPTLLSKRHLAAAALPLLLAGLQSCGNSKNETTVTSPPAAASIASTAQLPPAVAARWVRLEEVTEVNGKPWGSVAEINLVDVTGAAVGRSGWVLSADSTGANDPVTNAVDGRPETIWHTEWEGGNPPGPPHTLTIDLGRPVTASGFRLLPRQDTSGNGTIAKYRFYVSADGKDWGRPVAEGDFSAMGVVSAEKTVLFARQTENHAPVLLAPPSQRTPMGREATLQLSASDADGDALTYAITGLPAGMQLSPQGGRISGTPLEPGSYTVTVTVKDGKGLEAKAGFPWTVEPPAAGAQPVAAAPGEVRFVKLEQLSEVNGKPFASVAELKLLDARGAELPRDGWTASADSADTSDKAANAIDGNPATIWHSQWDGAAPPPPHALVVDLGKPAPVRGFRVLPRQDKSQNGIIARYRFFTSQDGIHWGTPVAEGDFAAQGRSGQEQTVTLK